MKLSHHLCRDFKAVLGERLDLIFEGFFKWNHFGSWCCKSAGNWWSCFSHVKWVPCLVRGYLKEKIILGETFGVAVPPTCRNGCHASFSSQILLFRSFVTVVQVVVTFFLLFCSVRPISSSVTVFFSSFLNFPININSFLQVASLLEFWSCFFFFFVESVCLIHIWVTALLAKPLCLWELSASGFGLKWFGVCLPWLESLSCFKAPGSRE